MTVIAWDGNIIAADKQATSNGTIRTTTKLCPHPTEEGVIIAGCGTEATVRVMAQWFIDGADISKFPECQQDDQHWSDLIIVRPGYVLVYSRWHIPIPIEDEFHAWGSGRELAIGAMAHGANAVEAVEVASQYDDGCGRGVDWYEVGS